MSLKTIQVDKNMSCIIPGVLEISLMIFDTNPQNKVIMVIVHCHIVISKAGYKAFPHSALLKLEQ